MKKTILIGIVSLLCWSSATSWAQDDITNAFDDLKRTGTVNEQESEMRKAAAEADLQRLLSQQPEAGFYCFTEDRMHDIRLTNTIPARWTERPAKTWQRFKGTCQPGEFYTWQIGIFSPFKELRDVTVSFSDLKNEQGKRIPASAFQCFNQGGIDTDGHSFQKKISVPQGNVQALWLGMDIPTAAEGVYKGKAFVREGKAQPVEIDIELTVDGTPIAHHGDDEGWRKSRLRWLNSTLGNADEPTAPYTPVTVRKRTLSWLGGEMTLAANGLPAGITTLYDANNRLTDTCSNPILAHEMRFVIETETGEEALKPGHLRITKRNNASIIWKSTQKSRNVEVLCQGTFGFDGISNLRLQVKSKRDIRVKDIRLEVPYTAYASRYMMGLGHKGGFRPDSLIRWQWDTDKHQDKIWMGNVNAGMNLHFMDEQYVRPLVNIYYALGKLHLPASWGNDRKGGICIAPGPKGETLLTAYSGERLLRKGDVLHYDFDLQVTPVKPIDLRRQAQERFYHSNSDVSADYIPAAQKAGANFINIHHKKDVYPFINYPYSDESLADLKRFIDEAHSQQIGVRLYYTTRELTVKIPELWALRSLGSEVIHDGPGKDTRTLIHPNGPNEWLNQNLGDHFIPAWYNAFNEGKYAGDMDISIITTPDSRWNNYYLAGLDWMVNRLNVDGIYIDDSALDRKTLQRARRILDADGKRRLVDIHSWNHMNQWAGYANSLHLYTELLPYVDRTWIGEGFSANNPADFWLVEMSGIPFGLLSETLDARNPFRGMIFGMLPRLPWSGDPTPLWKLWDEFGMKDASMHGYWDPQCPVRTDNKNLPATVYTNGKRALVVIANWTDLPQQANITLDESTLGFHPTRFTLPEIRNIQWGGRLGNLKQCEVMGRSGLIIWVE